MRNKHKVVGAISIAVVALSLAFSPVFAGDPISTPAPTSTDLKKRSTPPPPVTKVRPELSEQEQMKTRLKQVEEFQKERTEKRADRQEKSKALIRVSENQIARAERELKKLGEILVRVKAQRVKLGTTNNTTTSNTETASTDLTKIDEAIKKAEDLKTKVEEDLAAAKAKLAAMNSVVPVVSSSTIIAMGETTTTLDSNTAKFVSPELEINTKAAVAADAATKIAMTKAVKDFQTSMRVLKKDMHSLHDALKGSVKLMRDHLKEVGKARKEENKVNNSTNEGEEGDEND